MLIITSLRRMLTDTIDEKTLENEHIEYLYKNITNYYIFMLTKCCTITLILKIFCKLLGIK